MNKSFRGKLASGTQEKIRLSTNNGLTGYKIVNFKLFPTDNYGTANQEMVAKVSTEQFANVNDAVDFADPRLLAVNYFGLNTSAGQTGEMVVFDNIAFNQDIHVSYVDNSGNGLSANYYLELEQFKLSQDEATVATLKDMRGRE